MFRKILGNDLKRKKSMNFIILIFIVLATTFISGAVQNISVVISGIDYYLEQANVSDFFMVTYGNTEENDRQIQEFLKTEDNVTDYEVEEVLLADKFQNKDREDLEYNHSCLINRAEKSPQAFFNTDNNKIETISKGQVYLSNALYRDLSVEIGESIYVKYDDNSYLKLKVEGIAKDALLGSDLMGTKRILVGEEDYRTLQQGCLVDSTLWSK